MDVIYTTIAVVGYPRTLNALKCLDEVRRNDSNDDSSKLWSNSGSALPPVLASRMGFCPSVSCLMVLG